MAVMAGKGSQRHKAARWSRSESKGIKEADREAIQYGPPWRSNHGPSRSNLSGSSSRHSSRQPHSPVASPVRNKPQPTSWTRVARQLIQNYHQAQASRRVKWDHYTRVTESLDRGHWIVAKKPNIDEICFNLKSLQVHWARLGRDDYETYEIVKTKCPGRYLLDINDRSSFGDRLLVQILPFNRWQRALATRGLVAGSINPTAIMVATKPLGTMQQAAYRQAVSD